MTPYEAQRIVRRLASAEGYLELGLPQYALADLGQVPHAGPFEAIAQLLKGEALQAEERFDEAIGALNRAAQLFPSPFNQRALLGLSRCYRMRGEEDLAQQAEAAAAPANTPPGTLLQLVIVPIFKVEVKSSQRRPPRKG
uniref:Tetratricopeptide repeat protein n=1 Tax=Schlesneria paludicola TaxID=360056 RepID=A0A7C2JZ77_9PLAN